MALSNQVIESYGAFEYFEFSGPTAAGSSTTNLWEIPTGIRVIDAYLDVKTAATGGTSQTCAIQDDHSTPVVFIPATDTKTAALTRLVHGNNKLTGSTAKNINAVFTTVGTVTAAVVGIYLMLQRETYPATVPA